MNRIDKELFSRGLCKSRTAASDLIAEGKVVVNGEVCVQPSRRVAEDDSVEIKGEQLRYVSRGGLKLEHALNLFNIDLTGLICLDVGASTGGFTDCMLQRGASRVYAIDVGTDQLVSSLKNDRRVVSFEQCDIRNTVGFQVGFVAVDVSFVSLKLIIPELKRFLSSGLICSRTNATALLLIKPQFELGRKHRGVITDTKIQTRIVADITAFSEEYGFTVRGVTESPVIGKSGNREFLVYLELMELMELP